MRFDFGVIQNLEKAANILKLTIPTKLGIVTNVS
jgi:hypothetical protein